MKRQQLDEYTWRAATSVVEAAARQGKDPIEQLHRAGLIFCPAVKLEVETDVLQRLLGLLRLWRPHEMLRRRYSQSHTSTPAEMYECTIDFIEEFKLAQKGESDDK